MGWKVEQLSGKGIPDLAVLIGGHVMFIECKSKGGKMTQAQKMFASDGWPVYLAVTPEQAIHCAMMFRREKGQA